jgi:hypothetical protein
LQSCDRASDGGVRQFRLVQRDDHHEEANTETGDGASSVQVVESLGSGLERSTDDEDLRVSWSVHAALLAQRSESHQSAEHDCLFSSNVVPCRSGEHGSEEGASSEDRDDSSTLTCGWVELHDEVVRVNGLCDDTEIVTVEDRTDRGEHGHQEL